MQVRLIFVPPGGGEADYSLLFELPGVPRAGDYISIMRPGEHGSADFIVRRIRWNLEYPETKSYYTAGTDPAGSVSVIGVECEFAVGAYSSDSHKKSVEAYEARGKGKLEHEASGY